MFNCDETAAYSATSLAFRDRLITDWNKTQQRQTFRDTKRVYYLSLEFLMGRTLDNAMLNVGLKNVAKGKDDPPRINITIADGISTQMASRSLASESKTSLARSMMPVWATVAWAGWLPASSTAWLRSTTPPGAMVFATDTESSSRRLLTVIRSKFPTIGWTLTPGSFPVTTSRST